MADLKKTPDDTHGVFELFYRTFCVSMLNKIVK